MMRKSTQGYTRLPIYAIEMGDFIEFRKSAKPPKVIVTRIREGRKILMQQRLYVGGRVIGYMKVENWNDDVYGMVMLDDYERSLVSNSAWRKRNFIK